jgi:hypothetical protein
VPPLPPLNFTGGAAWGGSAGAPSPWDQGGWTVNLAGSGVALQSGGLSPLLIAAAVVGVAWLVLRK